MNEEPGARDDSRADEAWTEPWPVPVPEFSYTSPPKKFQDIYPVNFDNDPAGIRAEVLRIVRHWIAQGVKIFRVDNPHTKPLQFWEWLIRTVRDEAPDVVFLAEAFTRPTPLRARSCSARSLSRARVIATDSLSV